VPVRPAQRRTAWFAGMTSASTATLTLLSVTLDSPGPGTHAPGSSAPAPEPAHLGAWVWWDTEPHSDFLFLEVSADAGASWQPLPFSTTCLEQGPRTHPTGSVDGWSGRAWHHMDADLTAWLGSQLQLRWRCTTDPLYVGRGAYVDGILVENGRRTVFDESRPGDAARIAAVGWARSRD
jgi:bacillopeptidase F (M6 metalloprotease family)